MLRVLHFEAKVGVLHWTICLTNLVFDHFSFLLKKLFAISDLNLLLGKLDCLEAIPCFDHFTII